MQDSTQLFRTKRFLPLFVTQFFGAFNDNAFKNAFLIWFTYDVANHNGLDASIMVTIAAGLFMLPFFLFSATAGQLADKYEKSWLTQKIKQVEIVLMIACAVCFYMGSVYGLLIVLFLMGMQSTFFGPIKYSLLPEHLRDDELISGNGWIEGGTFLSILLGTIFGGLIIRTEYGIELLSVCLIAFAIIGWIASRSIPISPPSLIGDPQLKIGWNIAKETSKIIGYARKERTVWLSILAISWFWLVGATFLTQFPVYTKDIIGGNEHIVTLFLTVFSFGIGLGSVWCNKLLNGKIDGRLVPYGALGISFAILAFVAASYYYEIERIAYIEQLLHNKDAILGFFEFFAVGASSWVIVLSLLMLSVCSGIYIVPLYAIMQHRSSPSYVSRVIAANNVLNALFMVFASIAALILFSFNFTVTDIFLTVGVANVPVFFVVRGVVKRRLHNA